MSSETAGTAQSTAAATRQRPQTHKPRGVCRYYTAPRGCFAGDKCKFLHGEAPTNDTQVEGNSGQAHQAPAASLTPYDQAKRCRYYANGMIPDSVPPNLSELLS